MSNRKLVLYKISIIIVILCTSLAKSARFNILLLLFAIFHIFGKCLRFRYDGRDIFNMSAVIRVHTLLYVFVCSFKEQNDMHTLKMYKNEYAPF